MRGADANGSAPAPWGSAPHAARIAAASRLMAAGRYADADLLVSEVLDAAPEHVDALVLRASGAMAQGAVAPAFDLLAVLAGRHPDRADVVANLGVAHAALGRPEEAFACLEQAVRLAPGDGGRRAELAGLLLVRGDLERARAEILDVQRQAEATDDAPLAAIGWSLAARLLLETGRLDAAETALRRALALRSGHADDLALLSEVAAAQDRPLDALELAEAAYLAAPSEPARAIAWAGRLMDAGRLAEAEPQVRRVLATAPFHLEATDALARLLILKGEPKAGLAAFAALVRRSEGDPVALLGMARLLRLTGDLDSALAFTDQALARAPEAPAAVQLRTHLLLAKGRVADVWPQPAERPPITALSVPDGLPAGDVVLFARFARGLSAPGTRLPCHAEPALLPLLAGMTGLAPTSAPAPDHAVPLPALPALLGVGPQDLAAAPYLAGETQRHARWGAALALLPRPWIGLAFDAAPTGLGLAPLAAALAGPGTLLSLAFDGARADLSRCPDVVDAGVDFADARDLAALIAQLDLVAGSPGLALHMAGAMGVAAAAVISAALPWAFAPCDGAALWYPRMRVLRQERAGDWSAPLAALAQLRPAPGTGHCG